MNPIAIKILSFMTVFLICGCTSLSSEENPLSIEIKNNVMVASGVVDSTTPEVLGSAIEQNPDIKTLVLQSVPGSADDISNLAVARKVRKANMTTIVPSNGLVASGGTDLFLAGAKRIIEQGACIGVHSWAAGDLFNVKSAREFPKNDTEHDKYLDYYKEMKVDPAFYWFTLDAADYDAMYWMSVANLNRFGFSTIPLREQESQTQKQREQRCDGRVF